jgi:hypothetical protein
VLLPLQLNKPNHVGRNGVSLQVPAPAWLPDRDRHVGVGYRHPVYTAVQKITKQISHYILLLQTVSINLLKILVMKHTYANI